MLYGHVTAFKTFVLNLDEKINMVYHFPRMRGYVRVAVLEVFDVCNFVINMETVLKSQRCCVSSRNFIKVFIFADFVSHNEDAPINYNPHLMLQENNNPG